MAKHRGATCVTVLSKFFNAVTELYVKTLLVFRTRRKNAIQAEKAYGSEKQKWSFNMKMKHKYTGSTGDDRSEVRFSNSPLE
jgi:hypothetical protein